MMKHLGRIILVGMVSMFVLTGSTSAEVFKQTEGGWQSATQEEAKITVRRGGSSFDEYSLTGPVEKGLSLTNSATVDDRIWGNFEYTELKWFIIAPKTYGVLFTRMTIGTNAKGCKIVVEGCGNLTGDEGTLGTWYAITENDSMPKDKKFVPADNFNGEMKRWEGPAERNYYLWNKVKVEKLSPAGEYYDEFIITISTDI